MTTATILTASSADLFSCEWCRTVSRAAATGGGGNSCPRCGGRLRRRKRQSLGRTAAYLVAAAVLFVPVNLLPMMLTSTPLGARSDTIASGALGLWRSGSCVLAVLVFAASVAVPLLKIAALGLLVISCHLGSRWRARERTRLYRVVELCGRWSMLDIFVVALLVILVRSGGTSVSIGPGALALAAVVALTTLASASFDPRLIWDRQRPGKGEARREGGVP
jgi:paraquat-inducible protein A